jgi:hypothetical protein
MINLPEVGEKIVVNNIRYATAMVSDVVWDEKQFDFVINLQWTNTNGEYIGTSRVYYRDQNKSWFRFSNNN